MPRATKELLQERRLYEVGLKQAGLSVATIVKQVNAQHKIKGWGEVTRRLVDKDIATYYRENRALTGKDYDHLEMLREAHLSQIENTIEKLSLHISNKGKPARDAKTGEIQTDAKGNPIIPDPWKPFEYADSLDKLHKAQMAYAEMQNWNLGRKNPEVNIQFNNVNNIFDRAAVDFKGAKNETIDTIAECIDDVLAEKKDKGPPEIKIIDPE